MGKKNEKKEKCGEEKCERENCVCMRKWWEREVKKKKEREATETIDVKTEKNTLDKTSY